MTAKVYPAFLFPLGIYSDIGFVKLLQNNLLLNSQEGALSETKSGNGEKASKQHFILFPLCFLPYKKF